jgi:putative membrane protein
MASLQLPHWLNDSRGFLRPHALSREHSISANAAAMSMPPTPGFSRSQKSTRRRDSRGSSSKQEINLRRDVPPAPVISSGGAHHRNFFRRDETTARANVVAGEERSGTLPIDLTARSKLEKDPPMKYLAPGLALALLATSAMAQSVGEKTGVNSALGISPATTDFIKEVANSDMFEIQSSQLAQERGNASEKTFASQMVKDHTKTSEDLKSMVSGGEVKAEVPSTLDSSHRSKLDKLKSLKGADFSSQYDSDQISGHKDAVSLFERYSKSGDNPKLKDWAGKTLPTLRHHLEMAEELKSGSTVGKR